MKLLELDWYLVHTTNKTIILSYLEEDGNFVVGLAPSLEGWKEWALILLDCHKTLEAY
jgi:hypothetical protein